MTNWLKQSTAACIMLGPLVSNTDGYSPCNPGLAASDIYLSKNGDEFVVKNDSTAPSAAYFSWFEISLNTTDTNTLGDLVIAASVTGALPVWREFMILNGSAYDALVSGAGGITVKSGSVTDKTGYTLAASSIAGSTIAASAIDNGVFALTAASQIWNAAVRIVTGGSVVATSGSVVTTSNLDKTGYILAASSIAGSTLAASAITENVLTDKAASAVWNAAVKVITGGSVVATSGSVVTTSNLDKTNYGLSASAVDDIWNESNTEHSSASTYGWFIDKQITAITGTGATAQEVWEYATRALTDKIDFGLSASAVDDIWNEVQSDHTTASTFGLYLDRKISDVSGGSSGTTAADIWAYENRCLTASAIAASSFATDAIDVNSFATTAGSKVWDAAVRTLSTTESSLSASALGEIAASLSSASDVWAYTTRTLSLASIAGSTFAASAIAGSTLAASAIGNNIFTQGAADLVWASASRKITGGSINSNNDKGNYTIAGSTLTWDAFTNDFANILIENIWYKSFSDYFTVVPSDERSPMNALRFLRNRWSVSGSTLTVYAEDDTTPAWTACIVSAPLDEGVIGIDPT